MVNKPFRTDKKGINKKKTYKNVPDEIEIVVSFQAWTKSRNKYGVDKYGMYRKKIKGHRTNTGYDFIP